MALHYALFQKSCQQRFECLAPVCFEEAGFRQKGVKGFRIEAAQDGGDVAVFVAYPPMKDSEKPHRIPGDLRCTNARVVPPGAPHDGSGD